MSKVTETVTALAAPVAEKLGLELWDVEYIREAGQWFLRVYIDKDGGVSINDCEALSRALDPCWTRQTPFRTATFLRSGPPARARAQAPRRLCALYGQRRGGAAL